MIHSSHPFNIICLLLVCLSGYQPDASTTSLTSSNQHMQLSQNIENTNSDSEHNELQNDDDIYVDPENKRLFANNELQNTVTHMIHEYK